MNKVYLAGGMKSNWQDIVKRNVDLIYFDPLNDKCEDKMGVKEYGAWDLHYIKKCDIVFAYMEKDNPSGIGLSGELGFAKALGKTIILCLEKSEDEKRNKSLSFMKVFADVIFDNFNEAIKYLKNYE